MLEEWLCLQPQGKIEGARWLEKLGGGGYEGLESRGKGRGGGG